jgi:hypothetical protein
LFKSAIGRDPSLAEARIRLAWVRGLRGHHEQAAADLRTVVERDLDPHLQYLAWLLLGREELGLGRRAAALCPEAQSPRLGLSLLVHLGGNQLASLQILSLPGQASATEDDPWWTFDNRHEPDADELLAQMRRRLAP